MQPEIEAPEGLRRNELSRSAKKDHLASIYKITGKRAKDILDKLYGKRKDKPSTVADRATPVYVIYTQVDKVELEKSTGIWYAHFIGSWGSLAFGEEKPFEVGSKIKISFEEVRDDQHNQPPI